MKIRVNMMEGDEYHHHHSSEEEVVVEMMGIMGGANSGGSSSSSSSSSRWNPTKEQISMLENLYKQGIRTPTAEEIQQITARLRVYGHIEGKNVFYWFQNHKARQRQKQKQHSIAYFNRFLNHHHHHPLFTTTPPISPNVMCAPYCMTQQAQSTEMGFYHHHQHPKVLVPVGIRRNNPNNEKVVVPMGMMPTTTRRSMCTTNNAPVVSVSVPVPLVYEGGMMQMQQQKEIMSDCNNLISSYSNQETLDLFPLHPTGILEGKATDKKVVVVSSSSSLASVSADTSTDTASPDHHINHEHQYGYGNQNQKNQNQPFFNFFTSGQGPLESSG